jgi:hypothetical protein
MCHIVDSDFNILNHTIHNIKANKIQKDIFLCFLIQSFASSANTKTIPIKAALDNVIAIANIHNAKNQKFKFWIGFLKIFLNLSRHVFHHNNIIGRKATKK